MDARSERRRRLNLFGREIDDLVYRVGHHAHDQRLVIGAQFDDDDARAARELGGRQSEFDGEVDDRHDGAAEIVHSADP